MKCSICGVEHDLLELEPSFGRPDEVVSLPKEVREKRVKESDDLCAIWADVGSSDHRYFVRCVLKVDVHDLRRPIAWGLWAEVAEQEFQKIVRRWSDPDQANEPAMEARIANHVPGYPETRGLPVSLRLTGSKTRPALSVEPYSVHPFVVECRDGVCSHRVVEWLESMR